MKQTAISFTQRLLLGSILILAGCAKSDQGNTKNTLKETWSLTAAPASSELPVVKIGDFELRVPAEMRHIVAASKQDQETLVGPVRKDETYLTLMVIVKDLPSESADTTLEEWLEDAISGTKHNREDWLGGIAEFGRVNDHPFARASWSAKSGPNARAGLQGKTMHGMVYVAKFPSKVVLILFQDNEPEHRESLRLGESAVATFQKTSGR